MSLVTTATMRAALLLGGRSARHVHAPCPTPGPDEVRIRVEGCGVCLSSLPLWEGREWFSYPLEPGAPGHEVWGWTDDGRRVAALCFNGFAEVDVAAAATVVELPKELDGLPFPGEALACAVNVVRRAAPPIDARVAVVGMGFLGSAVGQLLGDVTEIRRHTHVEGEFDVVVEATGTQSGLDRAAQLVAAGGRLVIAGYHQDGPRTVDLQGWNWRGIDVVNAHEREPQRYVAGIRAAVQLAVDGVLDLEALITHRLPLSHLEQAFELATRRPAGFVKAVVCP
ncbi:MAG TPA: alcohol dehydrogenase catalytic domain-containing protein [Gaiellaceae bacterium]|nr:alcohol dehydrogenase catalytic domain-containing protein [Gaiellaceae bacterium]